tara:strand:- start:3028 stop:3780 length:753 start_codon:yes stop_codon:yes gene_type:complete
MNVVLINKHDKLFELNSTESIACCADESMASDRSSVDLTAGDETNHSTPVAVEMPDDLYSTAEGGDVSAQIKLACLCGEANGEPEDYDEAFRYHRKAADQGDRNAQFSVGFMYLEGLGVRRNYKEAFQWFLLAAEKGESSAQANLGWLYENGFGVPQNDAEAVRWYREAALNEDPYAALSLGLVYSRGRCQPTDPDAAYIWISIAAWNGVPEAEDKQEKLEQTMTPDQISMAWRRAKACISSRFKDCACI